MDIKAFFHKFASWHLWLNLLAMVAVVVLLFFGLKWWLNAYTHHGEGIEVPDFYGMDYRKAIEEAEDLGLRVVANDSTYIKDMQAGVVVVQTPVKGMNVKEGRTIYVTINSLTVPRIAIPDLIDNSSYREAQAKLQALDFHILPPKLIDGEKDWVYGIKLDGRDLHAGDMVARESQLVLVIGNGSWDELGGEDYFELPPLEGDLTTDDGLMPIDEAYGEEDDFVPVDPSELEDF